MDNHHFQRPETPPPSYDAATNGEKHQKCGSCLLLGKYLDVALNMGLFLFVNTKHIKTKMKHRIPGFKNWSWGSPTGKSDYWGHTSTNGHCKMMTIKCLKFSSARIIRIIDRLLGLSARMGKGRSWLGSDQDCLRACTNIQFVKYRQCVHKICMRSKNIQSVKRFSFRVVCLRIHFGKIVTIEQIQNHDNSVIFSTSCV